MSAPWGLAREALGRCWRGEASALGAAELAGYAEAIGDANPRYAEGPKQVAHPVACARGLHGVVRDLLFEPELRVDLPRLVHGEQDMRFFRLLQPGQAVRPEVHLVAIEEKAGGEVMRVLQRLVGPEGTVVEAQAAYFVRRPADVPAPVERALLRSPLGDALATDPAWALPANGAGPPPAASGAAAGALGAGAAAPLFEIPRTFTLAQSERFAAASGDHNPIHVDGDFARAVGLPGPIGHGMNTMAWLATDAITHGAGADPARLRRLRVRFSAMAPHGDPLTFRGWRRAPGVLSLAVEGPRGEAIVSGTFALLDS